MLASAQYSFESLGHLTHNLLLWWHKLGHKQSILSMATRVCPILQPGPLPAFLHPFRAWTNNWLIEAKSTTVMEIQHLLPLSLQGQKGGYYVQTSSLRTSSHLLL